jgi:methionyl aminopeptidase
MISSKSIREIELMRQAGRIVALAHQEVAKHVVAGVTTKKLDEIVEKVIRDHDAIPSFKGYGGFPASICASINDTLVHGIPDDTVLKSGDIISIDIGACYKGYHGDSAWTYAVGQISWEAAHLMEVTKSHYSSDWQMLSPEIASAIYPMR